MANRFWIGGSGNWADTSHWSASSGGGGGASQPVNADNVIFDANSFTTICTITRTSSDNGGFGAGWAGCTNFDSSAVTGQLNFVSVAGAVAHAILGNMNLKTTSIGGVNTYFSGGVTHTITTDVSTANTISPESIISTAQVNDGGTLSLSSKAAFGTVLFVSGTLTSNNNDFVCTNAISWNTSGSGTVNFGSSTAYIFSFTNVSNATSAVLNTGTSTVICSSSISSSLALRPPNNTTFYNLSFVYTGSSSTIGIVPALAPYNMTISNNLTITTPINTTTTIQLSAGGSLNLGGTVTWPSSTSQKPFILQSTNPTTTATISKSSSTVTVTYVTMRDITASGGATFKAINSTSVSNNSGWSFVGFPPQGGGMIFLR